jgi:hypothetical protein
MTSTIFDPGISNNNGRSALIAQPLTVVLTAGEREIVGSGQSHVLGVTVSNQGGLDAIVHLTVEPRHPQIQQWCTNAEQRLALSPGDSGEAIFKFDIAADAVAGIYEYDLVVDASQFYETLSPARYARRQLQVLPPDRDKQALQSITFWLDQQTSPLEPRSLQAGEVIYTDITVENRTRRVDRLRLSCDGLPSDWKVKIEYPKKQAGTGLIRVADSLGLNPGDRDNIKVTISSPTTALAGTYVPTFRLLSENNPTLGLLDLLYLKIAPIYMLQGQLQTLNSQVKTTNAKFEVELANFGNTYRNIQLQFQDQSPTDSCQYKLAKQEIRLEPKSKTTIELTGRPLKWWKRPWFGPGQIYNFQVQLQDSQQLAPVNPNLLPGYMTWMPRPWWQLLLAALLGLSTIGGLIWLLWWSFFRPPVLPRIISFTPEDTRYAAANNDIAQVGWEVQDSDRIQTIKLTGYSPEGEIISGPLVFNFQNGKLPGALASSCVEEKKRLTCRNVKTDARRAGQYSFELALIPKHNPTPIVQQIKNVTITPHPIAKVKELTTAQPILRERGSLPKDLAASTPEAVSPKGILLSWQVENPEDIRELHLIGRDEKNNVIGDMRYEVILRDRTLELPPDLEGKCKITPAQPTSSLVCTNIATGLGQVGQYRFELMAISRQDIDIPAKPVQTDVVQIQPLPFYINNLKVNGQDAAAFYRVPLLLGAPAPVVQLSWDVRGGTTTEVELLPSPGQVEEQGAINLPLNQQYGQQIITLQVKDLKGKPTARSITFEIFNPNPTDPSKAAAQAAAATAQAVNASNANLIKTLQQQSANAAKVKAPPAPANQIPPAPQPANNNPAPTSNIAAPIETQPRFQN